MEREVDLSVADNTALKRGAPLAFEALWYFFGLPLLKSSIITSAAFRRVLLRAFGAKIGKGVYIKPGLKVKFPWYLRVGDYSWLGEDLWIDNLAFVTIGSNACISQGAYICTGNHDWSSRNMRLFSQSVTCESGCWVGAKSIIAPGVVVGRRAVITAGSTVTRSVPADEVHGGNPAEFIRLRVLREASEIAK